MGAFFTGRVRGAWRLFASLALALACSAAPQALAASLTVLVDSDNVATTGCSVATPNGAFDGVEQRFVTTVDTAQNPPRVTGITREVCAAGVFGAPVSVSAGGWPVGIGNGTGGYNVIETALPIGLPGPIRVAAIYSDPAIGADAVTLTSGGGPIIVSQLLPGPMEQVPTLSDAMLALMVLLMMAVGWKYGRRHFPAAPLAIVVLVMVSTVAWAAIVLDGLIGDWAGIPPAATDGVDAPDGADVNAVFAVLEGTTLMFRVDARTGMPPAAVADSYTAVSGTPLNIAAAAGVMANDNRGIPAATVTSFGGGSVGGSVTSHAASGTATFGVGGSLSVNAGGGFTYTAATGFTGAFTFSYRISSINGTSDATVTINTQAAPTITSANATTFNVGTAGTFTVTATGFPAPTFSVAGALPAGVNFNNATGVLSGTPTAPGTFALVITAANGVAPNATQNFTLTVNQTVAITSANATTFTVGQAGTFTITTSATPTATNISIGGALPAGVTLGATSGAGTAVLSGTPNAGTGGTYTVTITASNGGVTPNGTQTFTLTVNQAPAITSVAAATFQVGTAGTHTVVATGFPAPTLSMTGALPAGVNFDTATGVLSGTATAAGSFPLVFTAANGVGANATQNFTLTVNQTVAITSANAATFTVGAAGTFTITTSATPVANLITITGALPAGVTLGATSGTGTAVLSGTPNAGTGGTYVVTITASNGGVTPNGTQTFTLTVNQAPAITSGNAATFSVGAAGTHTVTATGFPAPTFAVTAGTLPAGVTLNPTTGALAGTPGAGTGGTYPITITASNGVAPNATQAFTLTVNQAPAITSANATTFSVGVAGTFTVVASGVPASTFSHTGALPAGVTLSAAGVLSGTPAAATGGTYPITITANNGVAPNATQAFTLTVTQAPAITSLATTTFQVGVAGTFTVVASGVPASTFTTPGPLPTGVTLSAAGVLAGTPAAGTGGSYPFTITAANGVLPNATQAFTLTVTNAPIAVNDAAYTTAHDTPLVVPTLGVLANDDRGAPLANVTFFGGGSLGGLVTSNAAGATANFGTGGQLTVNANGSFNFTPSAGFAGTFTFLYRITNVDGSSDATVTITVTNVLPVVDLDGALTAGINSAATFTEGGGPVAIVGTVNPNALTITDADHTTLASATLVLTNALDGPSELLALTCPVGPAPACSGAIQTTDIVATPAPGTYTITITRVAPLADYQALLRSLTYNNASVVPNATQRDVTVVVNDGIGASNPVAHALVTIAGVNQAPTIAVPGAQTTPTNTARVFSTGNGNAITVADPDAGAADVQVTLTAANGTATLATTAGLTTVTGNGTATVVATGPLAALNTALNGASFNPTPAFTGAASLKVDINDLGNTGTGGPLSAPQATIAITVATAPTFTSANATTFTIGQSTPFTITTSASPTVTTITRGGVALPGGVTYLDNGNGTATLAGTPAAGTAGSYVFSFTATNGTPPDAVQNPFTLTIVGQPQTITFTSAAPGAASVGGATYGVTATATSALPVTFTIDASAAAVCSIAGSTVSFIGAGTCVINANQAGNATFAAAPQAQQSFTVAPGAQTISFTSVAPVAATFGGATYNVSATATSGLPVSFTIDASAAAVCSIAGSTVSFIGVGSCVINANQAGNANYSAAPQVQQTFAVAKASQTIGFTSVAPATATVGGATYGVAATATSGLPVSFTIDAAAAAVCTIAGSTVSFIGAGTCVVNANQAGNANYNAAPQVQQSFAVKSAQTISFTSTPPATATVGGATYLVTATATSALPVAVTIDASAAAVCTIAGSTVSFTGAGTCVINANQAGNATFYAAPQVQQSFTVKAAQAIVFTSVAPAAVYLGPTYTVTATGGASGNPVTFTIDAGSAGVCTIAGAVVSFPGTGNCVINANQLGNASFYDAPQVQQTVTVGPNLQADAYAVLGNTQLVAAGHSAPATPFTTNATTILANDTSNVAITLTTVTGVATTGGGLITIGATGAFTYTPPVGQSTGTDTYVYTGTSNGIARTATITFNIANVVWFVNQAAAGGGNGRSNTPFNTLNAADLPSLAGSTIYVHGGAGNTTGNLTLDANQSLRGSAVAFTLDALSLPVVAPAPTLTGTVALGSNAVVEGVNFAPLAGAAAVTGTGALAAVQVNQVNVNGGLNSISLTNATGTAFTVTNSTFQGASGAELLVSGGTIPLTFQASTTLTGSAGRVVDITGRTGGNASFLGPITDTGTGIFLNNNGATAFTFSGGMTLNGTGTTFTATNPGPAQSGSLSITGTNNIGATTAPTSGTALNVTHITFPAGGITFRSVHQNGGTNGIVINNTGSTAGLTVTGAGSAVQGGDNSGGTLQSLTGDGVQLTSTRNVSLTNMRIQNIGQSGIDGLGVTNFTFAAGRIDNVGTSAAGQYDESNISFNDGGAFTAASVDGTVSITNSVLNNARRHGIQIENGTGTISNLTITGNSLTSNTSAAVSLGTGILVLAQGSAGTTSHVTTGSVSNNTINNFPSTEGIVVAGGSGNGANNTSATLGANGTPIVINANTINGGATKMGSNAIRAVMNAQFGVANFTISNNSITNIQGQGVSGFMGGSITGSTTISNNTIVANQTLAAGTQGLAVQVDDGPLGAGTSAADYNFIITGNNVSNYEGFGIRGIARASNGKLDLTIQNNVVGAPSLANRSGIRVDSGSAVGNTNLCLLMTGNTSAGSGVNQGMGIRKQGIVQATNQFGIVGLAPSPTTGANAAAKVTADNPAGNGTDAISGDNFQTCTITP